MQNELLEIAKKVEIPAWATHIAVSKVRLQGEPCAWIELEKEFVDEDPQHFAEGDWASSYKSAYWEFFPVNDLTN